MQILTRLNKIIAYNTNGYIPVGNVAVCAATGERYDDVLITNVDCVPTDIDKYEYYYIDGKFIKGCSNSEIRETNAQEKLQFWVGTTAEYEALSKTEENTLYILSDSALVKELTEGADDYEQFKDNILSGVETVGKAKVLADIAVAKFAGTYSVPISKTGIYIAQFEAVDKTNASQTYYYTGIICVPDINKYAFGIGNKGDLDYSPEFKRVMYMPATNGVAYETKGFYLYRIGDI